MNKVFEIDGDISKTVNVPDANVDEFEIFKRVLAKFANTTVKLHDAYYKKMIESLNEGQNYQY
jgi:hypothetical protein